LLLSLLGAQELEYLTKDKQDVQAYKSKEVDAAYDKLRFEWLNPLSLSYSIQQNQSAPNDTASETTTASITLNQDLFRSGGIYYALLYAGSKHAYDRTALDEENSALAQQLVSAVLTIRRGEYQVAQSEYRLKNKEIEILIKRQQYEAGDVDITLLNNAIMDRNAEQRTLATLKKTLANARIDLQKLTDKSPGEITLPSFRLVERDTYMNQNYTVAKLQEQARLSGYQYGVTRAAYLPRLSLNGQYGNTHHRHDELNIDYTGDSYYLGLQLSIPLDYKTLATLEEAKAAELRTRSLTLDKSREQEANYRQIKSNIDTYREYIELTKNNQTLYDELLEVTEAGVKAGYRTGYDLQTLRNTKAIDEYEIKINELNIQLELAKLHYTTKEASR